MASPGRRSSGPQDLSGRSGPTGHLQVVETPFPHEKRQVFTPPVFPAMGAPGEGWPVSSRCEPGGLSCSQHGSPISSCAGPPARALVSTPWTGSSRWGRLGGQRRLSRQMTSRPLQTLPQHPGTLRPHAPRLPRAPPCSPHDPEVGSHAPTSRDMVFHIPTCLR